MAQQRSNVQFHSDPLPFLDQSFQAEGDAFWLPGRQLCLAEPAESRAVLANAEGLYEDHSDFFHTRRGTFGPRSAQVRIGRAARALLRTYVTARAHELEDRVRRELVPASSWPDAGNRLVYGHLADALVSPDSPARLRRTVDEIVERGVLAGAKERRSFLSRALFRFRAERELVRAVKQRRRERSGEPVDLLGVVVDGAGLDVPPAMLAEVFLSCVFAAAGSIGFTLGWSVYLLGTHSHAAAEPGWIVREALRLWPVAWMLGARPSQSQEVAGVPVTPEDEVVVCPYLVHRHPEHWEDPAGYRPERWAGVQHPQAFIPFGWGPHKCPLGPLSLELVEDVLRILLDGYRLTVTTIDPQPFVGPALAPPRFELGLEAQRLPHQQRGGE